MILDPDVVRIRESYPKECKCMWIRIPESGFKKFYADPRFAYGTDPLLRIQSEWARECYVLGPDHTM